LKQIGILAVPEWFSDPYYPLKSTTIRQGNGAGFKLDVVIGSVWSYRARFIKE
jgi:hypothetical protein